MNHRPLIKSFLFTALPCEAKPLVAHFKLKKDSSSHPFALYFNDNTVLVVSGCGKIAMAAAVAYGLAKFQHQSHPVLVNIGIAGHKTARLGDLFATHKITDVETGRHFYPQLITQLPCPTLAINTVSVPETNYNDACLYEMEASAFYEIAARFTSSELIQAFKIVSDNQESSIVKIDAATVSAWITAKVADIAIGIKQLELLAQPLEIKESPYYQTALQQWHFTVTAQLQLQALLQRWAVLTGDVELDFTELELKHSKAVLLWLEQKINSLAFSL
jgi:adenosylhomocysteine nucleosidase